MREQTLGDISNEGPPLGLGVLVGLRGHAKRDFQ